MSPGVGTGVDVEIARAHVHTSATPTGPVRARLRGALRRAELTPPGLPRHAVLIVRHTALELPRSVVAPSGVATRAWEARARSRLATDLAAAARPAHGPVPATATAVLFSDPAELVACLARDATRGTAAARWWWQGWRAPLRAGGVVGLLDDEVRSLPSVLETLHGWGAAVEVVAALDAAASIRLLRAVAVAFDLPAPSPAGHPRQRGTGRAVSGARPPSRASLDAAGAGALAPAVVAPWVVEFGASAVPASLGPAQAALLGTCLTLARRPAAVRSEAFAAVLREAASPRPSPMRGPQPDTERPGSLSPVRGRAAPAGPRRAAAAGATCEGPPSLPSPLRGVDPASDRSTTTGRVPAGDVGPVAGAATRQPSAPPRPTTPSDDRGGTSEGSWAEPADAPPELSDELAEVGRSQPGGIATELAGVLYLIGLVRALGLPDVVDPGWGLDRLGGWSLLEVLAAGLLDEVGAEVDHDPLWPLLADLDGRERALPDRSPTRDTTEPEVSLPGAALPGGWIEDAREHGGPRRVAALAGQVAAAPGHLTRHLAPLPSAWILRARPYLWWRLREALGGTDPVAALRVPGRLHVTRTHLDAVLPLASVSVAVRVAGLDRDPGWVPRLGRVVAFRFVEGPLP